LPDVLKLAVVANLDIAQARLAFERARVAQLRAGARFLPDFTLGSTYVNHMGRIQKTEGNIINMNRDSLWAGGGPTPSSRLAEAIFGLPIARAGLRAAGAGQARVTNETLLAVAEAYFNVLLARRRLARLDEALDFLTSNEERELRGNSQGLLPL